MHYDQKKFKVLRVKFDEELNGEMHLFLKQHKVRNVTEDRPPERTLFVGNVPPYCNEDTLHNVFHHCGTIEDVLFASPDKPSVIYPKPSSSIFTSKPPKGYMIAYIVFSSNEGVNKALAWNPKEPVPLSTEDCPILVGYEKYLNECLYRPDEEKLKLEIDEYMKQYDEKVKEKEEREKSAAEPDSEGWVNVTKKGRNPGFARTQAVKRKIEEKINGKRKKKELLNFYSFQIKESKMKHIQKLREKFEEDKKRLQELKSRRKFKPF